MPLVWAHAEHVKLLRSLKDGRVFDMPSEPVQRYQAEGTTANFVVWRFDRRRVTVAGKNLRIEVLEPGRIHWSSDGRRMTHDDATKYTGLGVHLFDLPAATLAPSTTIVFTLFWPKQERWEGIDFSVEVLGRK